MSNKYLPATEYEPRGPIYKLPFIGDALKNTLISKPRQEEYLRQYNERKLQSVDTEKGFNDLLLEDMRNENLLGANFEPIDDFNPETQTGSTFGAKILSVKLEDGSFIPRHSEFIEGLLGNNPLFTSTRTVQGTTEKFTPRQVVANPENNTVFIVGTNYKGDMAPKTLAATDADDDDIAEYTMSAWNQLAKLALNYKLVRSNYAPGLISMTDQDATALSGGPVNEDQLYQLAELLSNLEQEGALNDPAVVTGFKDTLIGFIGDNVDPALMDAQDQEVNPLSMTEVRPEIAELVGPQQPISEERARAMETRQFGDPDEQAAQDLQTQAIREFAPNYNVDPPYMNFNTRGSEFNQSGSGVEMNNFNDLSEEDQKSVFDTISQMSTSEMLLLASAGLLLIPGVNVGVAVGGAAIRGGAIAISALRNAQIGQKLLNFARATTTRPKKVTVAQAKSGRTYDPSSPQGKMIVDAGKRDMANRSTLEKARNIGQGNPRTTKQVVRDADGNIVREFSIGRSAATGGVSIAGGTTLGRGAIDRTEDRLEAEADAAATTPDDTAPLLDVQGADAFQIPNFKTANEAKEYFADENNFDRFVEFATSTGSQNVAAELEAALDQLGVTDGQGFNANVEQIRAIVNPDNNRSKDEIMAALLAERSGASKEQQVVLYTNLLNQFTDRAKAIQTKREFDIGQQNQTTEDFEEIYLSDDFNISDSIKEIETLFSSGSWDDITENNSVKLQRDGFISDYKLYFPEYMLVLDRNGQVVPIDKKEARLRASARGANLTAPKLQELNNRREEALRLDRIQTSQIVKSIMRKYRPGLLESIGNFVAGRGSFANPEDEIFPYVSAEVRLKDPDRPELGYDLVRVQIRQPGAGGRSDRVIEDQEITKELGNLESQILMSFYANLGKGNIKILNEKG